MLCSVMLQTRVRFYEHGDKASKLLAHQLRQLSTSHLIPQILTNSGSNATEPLEINNAFKEFYKSLYLSDQTSIPNFDTFFDNLYIPSIGQSIAKALEKSITVEELSKAVLSLQGGKCPGPDRFSSTSKKANPA